MVMIIECPLLKKYGVSPEDAAWDDPSTDWIKDVCTKAYPVKDRVCIYDASKKLVFRIQRVLSLTEITLSILAKKEMCLGTLNSKF